MPAIRPSHKNTSQKASPAKTPRRKANRRPALRPTRVLLADDDRDMRKLLATALKDAGYQVVDVPDGTDILRQLAYHRNDAELFADVDLVVTDVRMPGTDGFEVLQALREKDPATAVVLISAFADQPMRERAERLGATTLLSKPFALNAFVPPRYWHKPCETTRVGSLRKKRWRIATQTWCRSRGTPCRSQPSQRR